MHRKALTLIEVLIVLGIILVLSGIIFAVLAPSREKARRVSCASQMKQIYSAAALYATDYDGGNYTELGLLTYMPLSDSNATFAEYGAPASTWFCPDTPRVAREKLSSTYLTAFLGDDSLLALPREGFSDMPSIRQSNLKIKEVAGDDFAVIWCTIHDELQYQPSEGLTGSPWLMWLRDDGSLKAGRAPWYGRVSLIRMVLQ